MFDGSQAYLIFQSVHKYIKIIANTIYISEWKSKGLPDESIKPFVTSDNSLTPLIDCYDYNIRLKFNESILRQPKFSYAHGKIVHIFIVYELAGSSSHINDPTLKIVLFGAKMLILTSMSILVMELDLIEDQVLHFLAVDLVKMH